MSFHFAYLLSNLADQVVLVPLAVAIGLAFYVMGWQRGAVAWCITVATTLALTGLFKLVFMACMTGATQTLGLRSPSGHTAAAAVIYGGALALVMRALTGSGRWTVPAAVLIAAVIGQTRIVLGAHSDAEVLVGGLVGVVGAWAMIRMAGSPPPALQLGKAAAVGLGVVPFVYGFHIPIEAALAAVAYKLGVLASCR